jgi:hypothetical protein
MGYMTNYELTVVTDNRELEQRIINHLNENNEYNEEIIDASGYDMFGGMKWYDHEKDIINLSKKFPNVLIELDGEGEETGDIWKLYAKGGKTQRVKAELKFADFDESKLN